MLGFGKKRKMFCYEKPIKNLGVNVDNIVISKLI